MCVILMDLMCTCFLLPVYLLFFNSLQSIKLLTKPLSWDHHSGGAIAVPFLECSYLYVILSEPPRTGNIKPLFPLLKVRKSGKI